MTRRANPVLPRQFAGAGQMLAALGRLLPLFIMPEQQPRKPVFLAQDAAALHTGDFFAIYVFSQKQISPAVGAHLEPHAAPPPYEFL